LRVAGGMRAGAAFKQTRRAARPIPPDRAVRFLPESIAPTAGQGIRFEIRS